MDKIIKIGSIIMGIIVALCFILGVIGIFILKKNGKSWTGQGYGR